MVYTIYSTLYIVTGLIALITALLAYRRINVMGARELIVLMLLVTYWSVTIFLESIMETVDAKVLMSKCSYPAVVATPVYYFIFVQRFIGRKKYGRFIDSLPLFLIPVVVVILAWTNEYHRLIWLGFSEINPETNLILYKHGFGFMTGYLTYSYALFSIASIQLIRFIVKHKDIVRTQAYLLLIGAFCPFIASIFYLLNINITDGYDLTPSSISISGLLFIYAILNYRMLELVPVARETLLENVEEGILVFDETYCIQDINAFAKKILGVEAPVTPGTSMHKLNVSNPRLLETVMQCKNHKGVEIEVDGINNTYRINTIPLKTKPLSWLVFIRDITELSEKQKAVVKSEQEYHAMYNLFRLMVDNIPDMFWAKDLNKQYIFVNKSFCFSYLNANSIEEPIGKTQHFFTDRERKKNPENPEWFNIGLHTTDTDDIVLQTGKPGVFEEYGNVRGQFCYLDIHKAPILDENGKILGIVGSVRDITLQKKTEIELIAAKERAEESDRLKSSFLANMSHEVRTPMNSILGFISLMQDSNPTPEEQKEYFTIVKNGGERLMNTINDIIDISRIDSGLMNLNVTDTNLVELNQVLLSFFTQDASAKNLTLDYEKPKSEGPIFVKIDYSKLYTILSKLIKNAIKYTKRGSIRFGCSVDSESIRYFVQDTGIGIAKNRQKDIFDRFVQADSSINRGYEGSGLGLSLCKAYLEMMGGSIWLDSTEDVGTTFYFRIPLNTETDVEMDSPVKSENQAKKSQKSSRILIVEDDPGSFEYLNLILIREGYQITHTYTGYEAIELCRQRHRFDLILMDVKLPGIDGYETTRRIRDFNPEIPIVAISAFAFTEDHERAILAGCNDYITKPVGKDVLLSHVEKYS